MSKNPPGHPLQSFAYRPALVDADRYGPVQAARAHLVRVADTGMEILTQEQVAALLQIPPRTLEDWRLNSYGPPWRRIGRHVRYLRSEVLAWFQRQAHHG